MRVKNNIYIIYRTHGRGGGGGAVVVVVERTSPKAESCRRRSRRVLRGGCRARIALYSRYTYILDRVWA